MTTTITAPIAIWHGYLLSATGSNIYTYHLVRAWVRAGKDVVLVCQESNPERHPNVHDVIHLGWDSQAKEQVETRRSTIREPETGEGRCVMVVPDIDGLLPVYVLDRYEGFEVHRLVDLAQKKRDRYAAAQAAAARWIIKQMRPTGVLINHATPLPPALAPVLEQAGIPYAVKVHGSELEYALAEDKGLVPAAARALAAASGILVGSSHIEARTAELLGAACMTGRVAAIPPGVDLEQFLPSAAGVGGSADERTRLLELLSAKRKSEPDGRSEAQDLLIEQALNSPDELIDKLAAMQGSYQERHIEQSAPASFAALSPDARILCFVGKLIPQKGLHLLIAILPQLLKKHPELRVVIAGFGPMRDAYQALLIAMQQKNLAAVNQIISHAGGLAGESESELAGVTQFAHEAWLETASEVRVAERVTWLGLVDHSILSKLWPLCDISLVPSILAEAFGMVAAEAAACGSVPVVSNHSGLSDAADVIERGGVEPIRIDFSNIDEAANSLLDLLDSRLSLSREELNRQAVQARTNVASEWGWPQLAAQVEQIVTQREA